MNILDQEAEISEEKILLIKSLHKKLEAKTIALMTGIEINIIKKICKKV